MKYQKKPVVIEAIQYNNLNKEEIDKFVGKDLKYEIYDAAYQVGVASPVRVLYIETLEGVMEARPGDYIIKGVHGEFYPCKPDIFNETYVRVSDE